MSGRRERKVVTVVFADLAGFTSRAESMDPEDVAALLDPYYARLKSELERFSGTVEKFIGDAVVAVFGAPVAHEDDAERAVRAALAIRDWASEESIELRVGVNTGEALVILDAQPAEGQGFVAGDVVNTGARLQTAAPLGEVLVGERTFQATERAIEYASAEPVEAKGKASPVPVWRAVAARSRVDLERVQGARLVGRRRELDLLVGGLDRARQERSAELVTLVGVPGIGKSRLVRELYDRIEQERELTYWRHGRCLPYGEGVTFWALGEMVKAHAGILEGDDEEQADRKLRAVVDDPWVESHLRPLVGLSSDAELGRDRREEAFTAWRRFLEGLAEVRPLVLVFEDLHWADESLLDFIDYLIDWAGGVPLLAVCTARPELLTRRPGWGGGKRNALTISLSPLSDEDTARLLGELLERSVLPAETQVELLARAGGNPLYAEEFARVLRERGEIEQLPETVQGLIAARIDLLESEHKSLLQSAAVVGRTFWLGAVAALADREKDPVDKLLHSLERKEFVRRERNSSVAGELEYAFRHLLVRDVVYGQIPRAERARGHRHAAEWIGGLGRAEDHSEMLAHHYSQALELGELAGLDRHEFAAPAASAFADAGDRAFALNAYRAAVRHYRAALDLLPERDSRRGRLLAGLGRSLVSLGEVDVALLDGGARESRDAGDLESAAEIEGALAEHFWLSGERDQAFGHLSSALELVSALPPSRAKAFTIATAARRRMLATDYEEAIALGRHALAMAEELGLEEVRAAALSDVGSSHVEIGQVEEGLAEQARAVEVAACANAPYEVCRVKGNYASTLWSQGDLAASSRLRREARESALQYGQSAFLRWFQGVLLTDAYVLGRWDEAITEADAFIAEVEAGSPHYLAPQAYCVRALVRMAREQNSAVLADAGQAVALARRAKDPQILFLTLAAAAHLHWEMNARQTAVELADEFLAAVTSDQPLAYAVSWIHVLAWTPTRAGRGPELASALSRLDRVPWVRAAIAFAEANPMAAAELCAQMGAISQEAYARLAAAQQLTKQERRAEADEQLRKALAFYRSLDATRYVREGEALLAASA
jgi:class 3 adenylate cyclase/tetratricopeptide (TPR) repeat protein